MGAPNSLTCSVANNSLNWRFVGRLGAGDGAQVWRVKVEGIDCALKLAHPNRSTQLASEAERLAFSVSPRLPTPLSAGRLGTALVPNAGSTLEAGTAYLLLSFAHGEPLDRLWTDEPLPSKIAWQVALDVGGALADLHAAGVAHNDVKPANIVYDEATGRSTLIDLGLADTSSRTSIEAGTLRYLELDLQSGAPAQLRDLAALGLTLLEMLLPAARHSESPCSELPRLLSLLDADWAPIVPLLLGPAAARPSAAWLVRHARRRLSAADPSAERRSQVRRAYLATRESELMQVSLGRTPNLDAEALPGEWLRSCCEVLQGVAILRGAISSENQALGPLSERQRRQWLLRLIGASSVDFPPLPAQSDEQLAERLVALAGSRAPESLTLADLLSEELSDVAAPPDDPRDLALRIGAAQPVPSVLDQAERLVTEGGATVSMSFTLCDIFRRRHELGRALFVLGRAGSPETHQSVALRLASVLLRAGDYAGAERALDPFSNSPSVGATQSRARLAQGDLAGAERALAKSPVDVDALQAWASIKLSSGALDEASADLSAARAFPQSAEQRSRTEALQANLAQQRGNSAQAYSRFCAAAEHASLAGALVEEATYLIGVASTASHLGKVSETLSAGRRATLLFEHLGRPESAARAALARAAAFVMVGAKTEAIDAAKETLEYAQAAKDLRCRVFAHLVLCDVGGDSAADELERAETLLSQNPDEARNDDRIRIAARGLRLGRPVELRRFDELVRLEPSTDVRLEWWGERAAALLREDGGAPEGATQVLTQLASHLQLPASTEAQGFAFAYGSQLAAHHSDGDRARQLSQAAGEALRALRAGSSAELAPGISQLAWAKLIRSPRESQVTLDQLSDIESLISTLSERNQLKPLLNRVLDALVLWTGVERGLLLLRAPGGQLVPRAARNLARDDLDGEQLKLSTTLALRALTSGECVVAVDAAGELPDLHESVHALKLRSVLAVPILARGEVLGVAYLDDRIRRGAFGPRELSWVRLVATLAAVAIADTRAQLLLKRSARKAKRAEARLKELLERRSAELEVVEKELAHAKHSRGTRFQYNEIIGNSEPIRRLLRLIDRVSQADVPVLISGSSGSGKELVARALHENGARKREPFVTENCSAIPETLLESTLFGHVKGAFTGAGVARAGLFEIAHRGTLFLDEIGDMSLGMQSKLLRVLETGEVRRVGAERITVVDVRIIAASHKDLEGLVQSGHFREDLFYRLNVVPVHVPALKERASDIPLLVRYFAKKHAADQNLKAVPGFSDEAMRAMTAFDWPGNVRQLENETRRALVLSDGVIQKHDLSPALQGLQTSTESDGLNLRQKIDALETELVTGALVKTSGNQTKAAQLLGVSRFGLQKMVKRLKIQYDSSSRQSR